MMRINPRAITGQWNYGWALDLHTIESVLVDNKIETTRSEIGEAVYNLKYRSDQTQIDPIARTMAAFIRSQAELADIKAVLAVPPSDTERAFQPVPAIAAALGAIMQLPVPMDYLMKVKPTTPLKDMSDKQKRSEELADAFGIRDRRFAGVHVLLVDDIFRSGETLNAITTTLALRGNVGQVSVITATITRSRR